MSSASEVLLGLPKMNGAERMITDAAQEFRIAFHRAMNKPYGSSGLPADVERTKVALLPGLSNAELRLELGELVGLDGDSLTLEEATEAVRRMLHRLNPWTPGGERGYWSEADCCAIAKSIGFHSHGRAAASTQPSPSKRRSTSPPARVRHTPSDRITPVRPMPTPELCQPPLWLEWLQIVTYTFARVLISRALGLPSRFADTPTCRLHWHDSLRVPHGGDATPIILIHGAYTTAASMAPIGVLLQASRRVVCVDLPGMDYTHSVAHARGGGHTGGAASARTCSFEACVEAVEWLIDEIAPPGSGVAVDLLGHSFGANVALKVGRRAAAAAAERGRGGRGRVRHVHLLAPGGASASRWYGKGANAPPPPAEIAAGLGLPSPLLARLVAWLLGALVMPAILGVFMSPNTQNLMLEPGMVAYRRRHASVTIDDLPINLIYGEWDDLVAPRPRDGLAATFPRAEVWLIRRALHQLNVLNPATVCECVEGFAARHGTGGGRVLPSSPVAANGVGEAIAAGALALLRRALGCAEWAVGVVAEPM